MEMRDDNADSKLVKGVSRDAPFHFTLHDAFVLLDRNKEVRFDVFCFMNANRLESALAVFSRSRLWLQKLCYSVPDNELCFY